MGYFPDGDFRWRVYNQDAMVNTMMMNAFLNTAIKKNHRAVGVGHDQLMEQPINVSDIPRLGYRRPSRSHAILIPYRQTNPVSPKAASSFVLGRPLSVLIMTWYVAARVLLG